MKFLKEDIPDEEWVSEFRKDVLKDRHDDDGLLERTILSGHCDVMAFGMVSALRQLDVNFAYKGLIFTRLFIRR